MYYLQKNHLPQKLYVIDNLLEKCIDILLILKKRWTNGRTIMRLNLYEENSFFYKICDRSSYSYHHEGSIVSSSQRGSQTQANASTSASSYQLHVYTLKFIQWPTSDLSPAEFHDTRRNSWDKVGLMNPHFGSDPAGIPIRIRINPDSNPGSFLVEILALGRGLRSLSTV